MRHDLEVLARQVQMVLEEPSAYSPVEVPLPSQADAGKLSLQLLYSDTADKNDETLNEQILQFLFQEESYESTKTSYSYSGGTNRILITAKSAKKHDHEIRIPGGANTVAVIAAILCGCLFAIVPETTSAFVLESIVQPVSSALLCLLSFCRSLGLIPKP